MIKASLGRNMNQYWIPCVPRVFRHKALIGQQRRQPSVCWLPSVLPSDEEFQKVLGKCWARALEFATPCFPSGIWDWREAWLHPRFPRGASRKHGKGLQHCQSQGYPQRQSPGKGKGIWSCQRKLEGRSSAGTPNIKNRRSWNELVIHAWNQVYQEKIRNKWDWHWVSFNFEVPLHEVFPLVLEMVFFTVCTF